MKQTESKWYTTWFDTPYYHILYKDRNYTEAENFMYNLVTFLSLKKGSNILDVACGKGRHALYLNTIGYDVTGIDLSQNSISYAKRFENETLKFYRHDMCKPVGQKFDAVLNLFTSFGYFENDEHNINAIKAMKANMDSNAYGVIDFLNINYTLKHLRKFEAKIIEDIEFKIEKWVENGYLFKRISFEADGKYFDFTERLKCINLQLFKTYLASARLKIEHIFGNYNLDPFDVEESERLILVFKED